MQRKAAFQYNLLVETLSNEALYPGLVGEQLAFYSYDAYVNAFPKGIPFLSSPPQDRDGSMYVSEEQRKAGLPAVYMFPKDQKGLPYMRFLQFPYADDLVEWIVEKANNNLKLNVSDFKGLGKRSVDEQHF